MGDSPIARLRTPPQQWPLLLLQWLLRKEELLLRPTESNGPSRNGPLLLSNYLLINGPLLGRSYGLGHLRRPTDWGKRNKEVAKRVRVIGGKGNTRLFILMPARAPTYLLITRPIAGLITPPPRSAPTESFRRRRAMGGDTNKQTKRGRGN